jgi:hypothetical protein
MTDFTQYQIYELLNRPGPLWLRNIDLRGADLSKVIVLALCGYGILTFAVQI